jgi:hypothetical protein
MFNALLSVIYNSCSFHFNLCGKVVVIVDCDALKVQPLLCSKPGAQRMSETQLNIHCDPWIQWMILLRIIIHCSSLTVNTSSVSTSIKTAIECDLSSNQ